MLHKDRFHAKLLYISQSENQQTKLKGIPIMNEKEQLTLLNSLTDLQDYVGETRIINNQTISFEGYNTLEGELLLYASFQYSEGGYYKLKCRNGWRKTNTYFEGD